MIELSIRVPTPRELRWISSQWVGDVLPRSAKEERGKSGVPLRAQYSGERSDVGWESGTGFWRSPDPMHLVHPRTYRHAMRLYVETSIERSSALVADLQGVPEEPVGWIVYETPDALSARGIREPLGVLHYVRVLGPARRRGVATQLLARARAWTPAYLSPAGASLLRAVETSGLAPLPGSGGDEQESGRLAMVEG